MTALDTGGVPQSISPTTYYGYDADGNLKYTTDPRGAQDAGGTGTSTTVSLSYTTWYFYDALDRQTCVADALANLTLSQGTASQPPTLSANATTTVYDAAGNVSTVTDADGYTTTYQYNSLNEKTAEIDPQVSTLPDGDTVATPLAPTTCYGYDVAGNLKYQTDPRGASNAGGQGNGANSIDTTYTTWYFYDALDRRTCVVDALAGLTVAVGTAAQPPALPVGASTPFGATTTTYDFMGNVLTVTDPDGNVITYQYNALNKKTAEIDPAVYITLPGGGQSSMPIAPTTYYGYDVAGNLTYQTDPRGAKDVTGGLGNGTSSIDPNYTTFYAYDALNRKIQETDPPVQRAQDDGTLLSSLIPPITYYGYDPDGNLQYVTAPRGDTTFGGQGCEDPNYTTTYVYDGLNRKTSEVDPTVLRANDSNSTRVSVAPTTFYGYDAAGNLKFTTDPRGDTGVGGAGSGDPNYTTWYFYDVLNRQTWVVSPASNTSQKQLTEAQGLNAAVPGWASGTATTTGYESVNTTYDGVGNTKTVTDADGNRTSYLYDALNRQIQETNPMGFTNASEYDADGNLTQSTDFDGHAKTYLYDALGHQIQENWTGAMTRTINTYYDPDGHMYAIVDPAGASYYYQYDADGHVIRSCMAPGDMPENGSIAWTPFSGTFSATHSTYTYTLNNSPDLGTTVIATVTSTTSNGSSLFHPYLELMSPSGVIVAVADSGTQYSATLMVPLDEASTATAYWQVIVTGSPRYCAVIGQLLLHPHRLRYDIHFAGEHQVQVRRGRQRHGYGRDLHRRQRPRRRRSTGNTMPSRS